MARKKTTPNHAEDATDFICPLCHLMKCFREVADTKSEFFEHMNDAHVAFLKGIRALIDVRIETVKKRAGTKKSPLTKIKVED